MKKHINTLASLVGLMAILLVVFPIISSAGEQESNMKNLFNKQDLYFPAGEADWRESILKRQVLIRKLWKPH